MSSQRTFDAIVIGVGSMGAPTCYELAKRGLKVLGIEQFGIVHDRGSHSGQTRIIRKAYFEHPDYVPLLERAYLNWKEIEQIRDVKIYHETGLLYMGEEDGEIINGVLDAADEYQIPVEEWDEDSLAEMFPDIRMSGDHIALYEPEAGYLDVPTAIKAYTDAAMKHHAAIHVSERVLGWIEENGVIIVTTDKSTYECKKLIITAGAWAHDWIGKHAVLNVTRQVLAWMTIPPKTLHKSIPCWLTERADSQGSFYGFPYAQDGRYLGYKLGIHYPGLTISPDQLSSDVSADEIAILEKHLKKMLPGVSMNVSATATCMYTNTIDEDFIIDFMPETSGNILVAAGFSGHGFKFSSVIGEILADLATDGTTALPIDFLSFDRF